MTVKQIVNWFLFGASFVVFAVAAGNAIRSVYTAEWAHALAYALVAAWSYRVTDSAAEKL